MQIAINLERIRKVSTLALDIRTSIFDQSEPKLILRVQLHVHVHYTMDLNTGVNNPVTKVVIKIAPMVFEFETYYHNRVRRSAGLLILPGHRLNLYNTITVQLYPKNDGSVRCHPLIYLFVCSFINFITLLIHSKQLCANSISIT